MLEAALIPYGGESWEPEPLRICSVPKPAARRKISACTAPLHGAEHMHRLAPYLVEDWLNYHFLIGIDHFTFYDTDGSYEPYVRRFVEKGLVTYHPRWPAKLSTKLCLFAEAVDKSERRPMLTEPHALDACVWENRHVSEWVVVLHSFEEYLHSQYFAQYGNSRGNGAVTSALPDLMAAWGAQVKDAGQVVVFELFQEPMGGVRSAKPRSVLSTWTRKRGDQLHGKTGEEWVKAAHQHHRAFAWIVDPLNIVHTAVHVAQPRSDGQVIVAVPTDRLRVNHYIDLGVNSSRCLHELGGCEIRDDGIRWAEDAVIELRHRDPQRRTVGAT